MATAKRVQLDKKSRSEKYEVVTTVDGKETERLLLGEETTYVDQPDRVVLEMSLEEARAIWASMPHSTNSKAAGIRRALTDILYPLQATQASSGGGAACGLGAANHNTEGLGKGW